MSTFMIGDVRLDQAEEPCPDCLEASRQLWHGFRASCKGCAARAASRSPQYRQARDTGMQTRAYRALLEQYGMTHAEVREAAAADVGGREAA